MDTYDTVSYDMIRYSTIWRYNNDAIIRNNIIQSDIVLQVKADSILNSELRTEIFCLFWNGNETLSWQLWWGLYSF